MTLKLEGDLNILKMYPQTENEAEGIQELKLKSTKICLKVKGQGQKLRIMSSIIETDSVPMKPQQFPDRSF